PILSAPSEPASTPPAAPADPTAPSTNQHSESDPFLSHSALSPSVTTSHAAASAAAAAHSSAPFALASTPLLSSVTLIGGYHVYSSHVYSNRAYSNFASTASAAGNLPRSLQSHTAPSIPNLPSRFLSSVPPVASQASESASDVSADPAASGSGLPAKPAAAGSGIPSEPTCDGSAAGKDEDATSVKVSEAEAEVAEIVGGGNSSSTSSTINSSNPISSTTISSSNSSSGINRSNRFSSGGEGQTGDGGSGVQAWKKGPRQRGSRQTGSRRDLRRGQLWGVISRVRSNNPVLPAIEAWRMAGGVLDKELLLWAIRRCQPYAYRAKAAELSQWLITSSGFPLTYLDYQLALACAARCNSVGTVREMFLSFPEEFRKEKVYVGVLHHFARRGRTHKLGEELEWLHNQGVPAENASYRSKLQALLIEQEIMTKGAAWNGADVTVTSEGGEEEEEEGEGGGGEEGEGGWNDADWFEVGEGKEGSRKERLEKVLGDVDQMLQEMKEKGMMPDEVAYNVVLASLARLGQIEKMEAYIARMRADGGQPSGVTYNILIGAYALAGQFEKTDLCIEAMREAGERMNVKTYWSLMGRYAKRGVVERFSKVWEEVKQAGLPLDRSMYHSRIEVHSRAGDLDKAEQAFNEMCALMPPTTASFNVLLAALSQAGRPDKIPSVLQSMQRWGRPKDPGTYVRLITANLKAGDEEGAMRALREAAAVGMQRMDQKLPFSSLIQVLIPARNKGDVVRVKEIIGLSRTLYKMTDPRLFRDLIVTVVNRWEKDKESRDAGKEGQLLDKEEDPSWKRLVSDIHGGQRGERGGRVTHPRLPYSRAPPHHHTHGRDHARDATGGRRNGEGRRGAGATGGQQVALAHIAGAWRWRTRRRWALAAAVGAGVGAGGRVWRWRRRWQPRSALASALAAAFGAGVGAGGRVRRWRRRWRPRSALRDPQRP
ncbi:unnamed protein product, partial [Closterium sp. Naga37s-1]